jgi:hypothetical protein
MGKWSSLNRKPMNWVVRNSPKWIIAICVSSATTMLATSIVAIRRPTHIVIAADTLGYQPEGKTTTSHCKIHSSGGVFFAFAGFTEDTKSRFYPRWIASRALSRAGTIEGRSRRLAESLRQPLLRAVQRIYKEDPPEIATTIIGGEGRDQTPLQLLVFGVENGIPKVISVDFTRVNNRKQEPIGIAPLIKMCPGDGCTDGVEYWLLGERKAIETAMEQPGAQTWTGNDAADVRRLVEIEIADKPKVVQPPIDELIVDACVGRHTSGTQMCASNELEASAIG